MKKKKKNSLQFAALVNPKGGSDDLMAMGVIESLEGREPCLSKNVVC